MNCPEVRAALPDVVYGALGPEVVAKVEAHVLGCPVCRRELAGLREVRRLLAAAPAPPVKVDAAALYRQAAERQALRSRRWRRVTLAACAAGIAALTLTALSRMEIRVEANQVVVRWGTAPAPEVPTPPPLVQAPPAPVEGAATPAAVEERLRVLDALVQALAEGDQARDYQHGREIARLQAQLRELRQQSEQHWTGAERDVEALYAAQFPNRKGVNP